MRYKLTPEEQDMVDEANRLSANAEKTGRTPSYYFLNKCNSEAGISYNPVQVAVSKSPKASIHDILLLHHKLNKFKEKKHRSPTAVFLNFLVSLKKHIFNR